MDTSLFHNLTNLSKNALQLSTELKQGSIGASAISEKILTDQDIQLIKEVCAILNNTEFPSEETLLLSKSLDDYFNAILDIKDNPLLSAQSEKIQSILNIKENPLLSLNQKQESNEVPQEVSQVQRPIRSNTMDQEQVMLWIKAHPPPCQKAVKSLIDNTIHIGQSEFEKAFMQSVDDFNNFIQEKGSNFEYVIAVEQHKSNLWMAELARPHLTKLHNEEVPLSYTPHLHMQVQKHLLSGNVNFPSNIVFFDDGIYSGEQLESIIGKIFSGVESENNLIHKHNIENPDRTRQMIPKPQIIIVCPYITQYGEHLLKNTFNKKEESVIFMKHEIIKTVKDVVQGNDLMVLKKIYAWKTPPGAKEVAGSAYRKDFSNRGIFFFDHKIPDDYSFPKSIADGTITDLRGTRIKTNMQFSPIPKTVPPYKPEFQSFCNEVQSK